MEIIHELKFNNVDALRLFSSQAEARRNNLRIHYHSLIELSIVIRGSGIYKTKNAVYTIQKGDIFFFRPNEAHCITDIEEGGMELRNLHIAPYYLYTNFQNALNTNYIKILSAGFPLKSNKINDCLSLQQTEMVRNLLLTVHEELHSRGSDYITAVQNYLSALFIQLSRVYAEHHFSQKDKQNYQKLLTAIAYIDTHYKEEITLDTLAKEVSYSKCYFSSVFKKCMGLSVWDYICIKRIEEALALIKTTNKSILDIALECGFNNTVNFNKIFKKYTNLTPSAFRK